MMGELEIIYRNKARKLQKSEMLDKIVTLSCDLHTARLTCEANEAELRALRDELSQLRKEAFDGGGAS